MQVSMADLATLDEASAQAAVKIIDDGAGTRGPGHCVPDPPRGSEAIGSPAAPGEAGLVVQKTTAGGVAEY